MNARLITWETCNALDEQLRIAMKRFNNSPTSRNNSIFLLLVEECKEADKDFRQEWGREYKWTNLVI